MEMFLSDKELIRLTKKKRKDCQIKALRFMGIEYKVRPDGSVVVLREHVNKVMHGEIRQEIAIFQPNWAKLNA